MENELEEKVMVEAEQLAADMDALNASEANPESNAEAEHAAALALTRKILFPQGA